MERLVGNEGLWMRLRNGLICVGSVCRYTLAVVSRYISSFRLHGVNLRQLSSLTHAIIQVVPMPIIVLGKSIILSLVDDDIMPSFLNFTVYNKLPRNVCIYRRVV